MNRAQLEQWMEGYIRAWNSNEPGDIRRLFSEDARYYTAPYAAPWQGQEEIIADWLARKDEPGSFTFRSRILAVTDDLGVVRGWTEYLERAQRFSNLWLIRLGHDGRCTEFIEWWMLDAA